MTWPQVPSTTATGSAKDSAVLRSPTPATFTAYQTPETYTLWAFLRNSNITWPLNSDSPAAAHQPSSATEFTSAPKQGCSRSTATRRRVVSQATQASFRQLQFADPTTAHCVFVTSIVRRGPSRRCRCVQFRLIRTETTSFRRRPLCRGRLESARSWNLALDRPFYHRSVR